MQRTSSPKSVALTLLTPHPLHCLWAAITKPHRQGGLGSRNAFHTVLEAGSLRSRYCQFCSLGERVSGLQMAAFTLCPQAEERENSLVISSWKGTDPITIPSVNFGGTQLNHSTGLGKHHCFFFFVSRTGVGVRGVKS